MNRKDTKQQRKQQLQNRNSSEAELKKEVESFEAAILKDESYDLEADELNQIDSSS